MDVQAQDSGLYPDPITAVVPASARTPAITFHDKVYSDTAPTPVVAARSARSPGAAGGTVPACSSSAPSSSSWPSPCWAARPSSAS